MNSLSTEKQRPRLAKAASARLRCTSPTEFGLKTGRAKKSVPIPTVCGRCYACVQNRELDAIGRAACQSLESARIDFLTLTYDSRKGVHERAAALVRMTSDLQNFKKRLRRKENYELTKYNARETDLAQSERRPARLVDTSRSYIKFMDAFERGSTGTKRSHWHVLVFWESHFPVPDDLVLSGNPHACMSAAARVWDIPQIYGPQTPGRPPEAENPEIIDHRVQRKSVKGKNQIANQPWGLWPHGNVVFDSCTHDVTQTNLPLKSLEQIGASVKYLQKYQRKAIYVPRGKSDVPQEDWTPKEQALHQASLDQGVQRTESRQVGHRFARLKGQRQGVYGVQFHDMIYRIDGFHMKTRPITVHKHQSKFIAAGMSQVLAERLTDTRQPFEFRGAHAQAVFEGYCQARVPIIGKAVDPYKCGDAYLAADMKKKSQEFREYLKAKPAVLRRALHATTRAEPLQDELTPVEVFVYDAKGCRKTGPNNRDAMRPIADRHRERMAEIDYLRNRYESVDMSRALRTVKRIVGLTPLAELETETRFANRTHADRERWSRRPDARHYWNVIGDLGEKSDKGDFEAQETLEYLENANRVQEMIALNLPRHSLSHPLVPDDMLMRWVNTSYDYSFPALREMLIAKYCRVIEHDPERRTLITPQGDVLIQRKSWRTSDAIAYDECSGLHIKYKPRIWATRRALTDSEESAALAGTLKNRNPSESDFIFRGEKPLCHL